MITEVLTIYSQDGDTYEFQRKAEVNLRKIFAPRIPATIIAYYVCKWLDGNM